MELIQRSPDPLAIDLGPTSKGRGIRGKGMAAKGKG